MDKLISLSEFVTNKENDIDYYCDYIDKGYMFNDIIKYNNFLKQPLTLAMFVPCDLNGNVIKEYDWVAPKGVKWEDYEKELLEAKSRVLFEGFKVYKEKSGLTKVFNSESNIELYLPNNNKVERLAFGKIVLTESAKKQIFGV